MTLEIWWHKLFFIGVCAVVFAVSEMVCRDMLKLKEMMKKEKMGATTDNIVRVANWAISYRFAKYIRGVSAMCIFAVLVHWAWVAFT